jgi:putative transposase
MVLNNVGEIVLSHWKMLPERFAPVVLDEYVLMPNHLHGIIYLIYSDEEDYTMIATNERQRRTFQRPAHNTLGEIIRSFKAATARTIRVAGHGEFTWQRNYYEHVIRHEKDLERVRLYIANNPARWSEDELNTQ